MGSSFRPTVVQFNMSCLRTKNSLIVSFKRKWAILCKFTDIHDIIVIDSARTFLTLPSCSRFPHDSIVLPSCSCSFHVHPAIPSRASSAHDRDPFVLVLLSRSPRDRDPRVLFSQVELSVSICNRNKKSKQLFRFSDVVNGIVIKICVSHIRNYTEDQKQ